MPAHPVIELRDVDIDAAGVRLVRRLSVDVAPGRVLALVSEGALTRAALAKVLSGHITDYTIGGDLVMEGRELVSRVGNSTQAELHVSHIAGPLDGRQRLRDIADAEVLTRVGLTDADARVSALPNTDRVRAAFAHALQSGPRVVVLELPVSPDAESAYPTYSALLHALSHDTAIAYVVVTDSMAVAADVADDVLVLLDGVPVEWGSVYDVCLRPAMPYVHDLVRLTPSPHRPLPEFTQFVDLTAHQGCPWVLNCRAEVRHECSQTVPRLQPVGLGHAAACHLIGVDHGA